LFWLIGVVMVLGAINMGRRKAAIAIAGGQLMAMQTGIFGSKKQEWEATEVTSIHAGPSGMEVNDRPVLELQIIGQGKKFGLLCGRSDEELHWLAALLRQELGIASNIDDSDWVDSSAMDDATGTSDENPGL
jgi:hypothetical protein